MITKSEWQLNQQIITAPKAALMYLHEFNHPIYTNVTLGIQLKPTDKNVKDMTALNVVARKI